MSVSISFSKLFTYAEDTSDRLPLSALSEGAGHIHGILELRFSGRVLPHMGFFGPDDVCFNTWVEELSRVMLELKAAEVASYTFDEGEQGQPAFAFHKEGGQVFISVVESSLSGAKGDQSYQRVNCQWSEFQAAVSSFFSSFYATVSAQCPKVAPAWWVAHAQPAA
jgi:hypothetical protein